MKIIFFDHKDTMIKAFYYVAYHNQNKNIQIEVKKEDVRKLVNSNITALVSPANSFGFMDGGIDKIYSEIMNTKDYNVQNDLQAKIKKYGVPWGFDYYIPIGCALRIKTNQKYDLISSPTMLTPKKIVGTNNVYLTMKAILQNSKPNDVIACPGLGTGVGQMDPMEAAKQIIEALNSYKQ